jgi:formate dehydrogenase iron-sulfur subunit
VRDRLTAWALRHASAGPTGNALGDLVDGVPVDEMARARGLPLAAAHGIRTFYDQIDPAVRVCDGTACHFAGSAAVRGSLSRGGSVGEVRCLGRCYDAPSYLVDQAVHSRCGQESPRRRSLADPAVVLRHVLDGAHPDPDEDYALPDGEAILAAVAAARLRGRGGAAYPTAAKWRAARDTPAPDRYVVCNGDEGDPGSFVDRVLLEEDPHAVLAGMVACARVIGASRGFVYVRAEYPRARAVVAEAVDAARAAGHLGRGFDVEVVTGAGSYLCGEETALLQSIQGQRGEPSPRPPYPATCGIGGLPTVVQNVETLAVVPWVARGRGSGTKAVSVSGAVASPGLLEVPFGTPIRQILEDGAGGPRPGSTWGMALVGGPMGRVVQASAFDTPLGYDTLPGMGHAGIVVLDPSVSPRDLALHLMRFARLESCGACTPCRVGTSKLADATDRAGLERLLETMTLGSLCGFGVGVPRPLVDLLAAFGDRVLR